MPLVLRGNNLTGPIPPEIGSLDSLEHLDLAHNPLNGPIPPELGSLARLKRLFLESSRLTGEIPPEIGNLEGLTYLELASNPLTGEIPGKVIREDLEMVIEVDSVDASLGVPRRIPEEGRMVIEVDSMPPFKVTATPSSGRRTPTARSSTSYRPCPGNRWNMSCCTPHERCCPWPGWTWWPIHPWSRQPTTRSPRFIWTCPAFTDG